MDFHKSLFWNYFIIIMKMAFIVYDLNPTFKQIPRINTTLKGTESVPYFGPVILNNVLIEAKKLLIEIM